MAAANWERWALTSILVAYLGARLVAWGVFGHLARVF